MKLCVSHEILLYYKYTRIANPQKFMEEQRALCKKLGLKGRIIIAREGINGTVEGLKENTDAYCAALRKKHAFKNIHLKKSDGTGSAFPRLSVKVRSEIVTGSLGEHDVNPNEITGKYLSPEQLRAWIESKKKIYIVDIRNDYEYKVGHFKGSIFSDLQNFRDLPAALPRLKNLRNKTVVAVCTGGVRCEKASGFLLKNGFKKVYQLDGGIVSYMEKYPNQDFLGALYVFDNRIVMSFPSTRRHIIVGRCEKCKAKSENYVNCQNLSCHIHFICCQKCYEKDGRVFCGKECAAKIKQNSALNA